MVTSSVPCPPTFDKVRYLSNCEYSLNKNINRMFDQVLPSIYDCSALEELYTTSVPGVIDVDDSCLFNSSMAEVRETSMNANIDLAHFSATDHEL